MLLRRLLVLALLALPTGVWAGCGAADDLSPDAVAQAADVTASAGGARVALTVPVNGTTLRGSGFVDLKGHAGTFTFSLPQGAGELREVFENVTLYLALPPRLAGSVPGHKPWVKIDLARAAKSQGLDLGALGSSSSDPAQTLEQLRGAGDVRKVGAEEVRGVPTTHYHALVDLRRAAQRASADRRAAAQRTADRLVQVTGRATYPIDAWLDRQGRVRRERLTVPIRKGVAITTTMELYDFGTKQAIVAPPDDQTYDVTDQAVQALAG